MLKIQQWIVFLVLFAVNAACFALPFDIYPTAGTTLPTFVQAGQSASAFYTITNNANKTLNNNYVKYLPLNVAQVTTDATIANLCGPTFNLAPNGTAGDSCTLELAVGGTVNANDPDPHHHLFACLFGGVLCAGTNFPLNVESSTLLTAIVVNPATPTIADGQTQQFTATAVFSDGSSADATTIATWTSSNPAVATINSSGLATSVSAGTTTITATLAGVSGSTVLTVNVIAIVAGNYQTTAAGNPSFPILIQTPDGGSTWTYTVDSSTSSVFPPSSSAFTISGASCSGGLCLSVGSYSNGVTHIYGFQTQNAGTSYTTAISDVSNTLPTDYASGSLSSASCSGTVCIAAGLYNSTSTQYPLVMQTTNSGASYVPVLDSAIPTLPAGLTSGAFTNSTCTGTICLASGNYTTGGTLYPLLAQSVPSGEAWAYAITSTNAAAITDYNDDGIFNASACNTSNCAAAGSYFSSTAGINQVPLIAQATGTGTAWTYEVTSANKPPDYSAIGLTSLNGAACATDTCIAVGNYGTVVSGDNQDVPLIYQSISGGAWTIVLSNTVGVGPSLPANLNAYLQSASCSGTLCVAAGTYVDAVGNTLPLILVSTNSGGTWRVAANPTAPANLTTVTIGATSCQGTFCTIAANYSDGMNNQPLVIQTINSGTTFTYSVSAGSPAEPADALNVFFMSTSISSLMNHALHKDFDHAKQLRNRLTHY